ncbi:unnamed protein product [Discosporangium mesarthrocarpum]
MRAFLIVSCCLGWLVPHSSSFIHLKTPIEARAVTAKAAGVVATRMRRPQQHRCRCERFPLVQMNVSSSRRSWVSLVSSSIVANLCAPSLASAAQRGVEKEPLMQVLVQMENEETEWQRFYADPAQALGARLYITASKGKESDSSAPLLGASVAMGKFTFPVLFQLFPENLLGDAKYPADFDMMATYTIDVRMCAGGEGGKDMAISTRGCKVPTLVGSSVSLFVTEVEDVPEVAEAGGVRVPATVILSPP